MLDPKKLRFRLILLSLLVILFLIGFLKNHVFAFPCNTVPSSWNHNFSVTCNGSLVEGNFIFGNVNADWLDYHQWRVFSNCALWHCLDGSTLLSRIYMDQAFHADGFAAGSKLSNNISCFTDPPETLCVNQILYCSWTGGIWRMMTGSTEYDTGYCGWWGLYEPCNDQGVGPPWCEYHSCPVGKHLNSNCVCVCNNVCNVPAQGGCQTQNEETCVCECPEYSHVEGEQCVANGEYMIFNPAVCGVCDPIEQFGTFDLNNSGVYWMPFPNPPGVTLDMMFYGTDKGVSNITWECLNPSSGKALLSISDPLLTYEEIYPTLQANCAFAFYTVPDFGGTIYRTFSTYVWFTGETQGVGLCDGIDLFIHTKGFIGELKTSEKTESHGTMYHSEGHGGFKNRGRFGGGYEIKMP